MKVVDVFGESIEIVSKVCRDCKIEKHIEEFEVNRRFFDASSDTKFREVRRPSCRECRSKKVSINRIDAKKYSRPVSLDCPICHDTVDGSYARLDHCHKTGKVRGWTCDNCNTAIGKLKESVEVLQRAIKWLGED